MPRIQLPSVQQQPSQPAQFSAPNVAPVQDATAQQVQGAGRALQQHGQAVSGIAADLQDEYDAALVNKADLAANEVLNQDVGGYLDLIGEPATGEAKKKAMESADRRIRAIQQGLGNEVQKELFQRAVARRTQEWNARADRHQRDQTRNFSFGMHAAKAQTEGMDAVATVGTDAFLGHKEQMLHHVDSAADLQGLSEDGKKLLRLGATTQMHTRILKNMVEGGHATAASEYLAGAKGEIAPDQLTQMQGLVRDAGIDDQATNLARDVNARSGSLLEALDTVDRMHAGKEIPDEVRLRAVAQLEHDADRRRVETDRQQREVLTGVLEWASAGNELTPQQRADLQITGQMWKYDAFVDAGGTFQTSEYGFRELHTASADDLLKFKTADEVWDHYRTEMGNDDLPRMVAKWHSANVGAGRADTRSQQQQEADLVNAKFDDEAEYYFMRLPESNPNWTEIPKQKHASLASWKRSFRLEVNAIGRANGHKEATTEVYREAFDNIMERRRQAPVRVDGDERTLEALTRGETDRGSIVLDPMVAKKTGTTHFDLRLATPDLLQQARDALALEAPGIEFSIGDVYNRAAEFVAESNRIQADVVPKAQARGRALMSERVRSAIDNSDMVRNAWRMANEREGGGGLASPQGYRSRWDASLIEPSTGGIERAMVEQMMDSFGWKLADEFGIDRDDMWRSIQTEYENMRRAKAIQEVYKANPSRGSAAGLERYDVPTPGLPR